MKNFIKKWSFLLMWAICGFFFLEFFDTQNVYGGILPERKETAGKEQDNVRSRDEGEQKKETGAAQDAAADGELDEDGEAARAEEQTDGKDEGNGAQDPAAESVVSAQSEERVKTFMGYAAVEDDYFDDALFIGDSRTVGLWEYGGLEGHAAFYASKGLTIFSLPDAKIVSVEGQREKLTIYDALEGKDFKKIYLMVGINELGTGDKERFVKAYSEVLERLHELQPEAVIYIQAILKVTTKRSGQGDYITNEGIGERNEGIRELADNVTYFYLDANPVICDESGGMKEEYTTDGVHLKGKDIHIWKEFLEENAVVLD